MREVFIENIFKKDYKRIIKQQWNITKVDKVIEILINDDILPERIKD
ncbi:type II toxin-antitoxin system YafQ family toxin [Campylobacter aviculae]|uniref:Type II toxin-antitoxin system mRNA interferase toxin, RelE/StbE family n=1 Tax=Campylobacter aviculae TaxID=2510190 RepID=A0A4V6DWT4_9BACT|nr:type II toxin-antitoxin system YafQ family toxin [Campylobacter aviculae]TKX32572.1 hypothetical protein CQA76_02835 [Campylobacter aviculae]